jgi:hypothetical protein
MGLSETLWRLSNRRRKKKLARLYFERQKQAHSCVHSINNALQYCCVKPDEAYTKQEDLMNKEKEWLKDKTKIFNYCSEAG